MLIEAGNKFFDKEDVLINAWVAVYCMLPSAVP